MHKDLDCRGLQCPAPVLSVRNAIEEDNPVSLAVLVDNDAARQNVSRFLEHRNYRVSSEPLENGFRVVGARDENAAVPEIPPPAPVAKERREEAKKIMVLITSDTMGRGDDALGEMLMFNYLKTLKEMGPELWRVVFVNSGVKFTAECAETIPVLRELADSGVMITSCGACLAYFHLLDKLQVGEVTNMLEVVTGMKLADSVVTV